MNRALTFDGKRTRLGWALAGLAALTAGFAGLAPVVSAQEVDIVGPLTENVRCFGANAKEDLGFNIKKLGMPDDVTGAALNRVAADATRCAPMREAATELAAAYIVPPQPTQEELAAEAARQALARTLAEARQRVVALKFETGPPPRNMTRGRAAVPGFRH